MRKLFSFITVLILGTVMMMAQNKTITGRVISAEDGEPIIGASVLVTGTQNGTVTDIDGNFSLKVNDSDKTLTVSYVGLQTQTAKITSKAMSIVMSGDDELLDEVMVVAYGTAKKSSFTGSASSVSSKKMELRPITSATKAIEGQTTGVLTTSGSGQPGESGSIVIRGFGSINASQDPLYVVDGIPFSGNISSINPTDIESLTVLKDASAGALYGARGANGVVMITTKKGKEGKTKVMWRSTLGWSDRAIPAYEMVNQKENVQLVYEAERNAALDAGYDWAKAEEYAREELLADYGGTENYNPFKNYTWNNIIDPATGQVRADAKSAWNEPWLDAVLNKGAFRHEHQLSINGGTDKTKYMFSLGYLNEDGILRYTNFQRYNARANVDSKVTDWFSGNLNISASHNIQNYQQFTGTATSNVWYTAQFANPLFPVYMKDANGNDLLDADGNRQLDYGTENGRFGSNSDMNPLGGVINDVSDIKGDVAGIRTGLVFGGDSKKLGWAQGLKLSFNFGVDYRNRNIMLYYNMYHGNQANANGLIYRRNNRTVSYTFNQLLTWNRSFGKHNVDLLAGHEFYAYQYQYLTASKTNLVEGIYELYPATTINGADSYSYKHRIESWLGRANYNYDDKYYASASFRRDGSSRFQKDARWGSFWSVGGSWRISKESWMENASSWLDNLSLRASYGEQGNESLDTYYAWQALYDVSYANGNNVGALAQSLENKDISWEKNGNFNIGLDFTVLNNRLGGTIEFYNKSTKDMLLNNPMALSTGFAGFNANVGDMYNRGWEFEVHGTPIRTKDWTWNMTVMASTTSNKVTKLTNSSPKIVSGVRVIEEGYPVNTFYMAQAAGVDPETGKQLYWVWDTDENGNRGEKYKSDDYSKAANCKEYLGSRIPDLYGSISTDVTWKNLSLSVLTTYSIGGKIYDSNYAGVMNLSYLSSNWHKDMLDRWQKPGDITDVPRVEIAGKYTTTDRFLKSASYFAIKNITLSYSFPKKWMNKAGLEGIRVFGSCDNLALFSALKGMDPQYNFSGGTDYSYTPNKTYSLGIEINF